jgi:flagellar hook protein FlgE
MASEVSTIQSLKAVDAWIDVINANINGGVRTAFKSSRLKFSGSNIDVARAGSSTSLPLQFPEPGLTTANTVIDFSQGAITASTETTHLAIQGEGFFLLATPQTMNLNSASASFGATLSTANAKFYVTRDGEFRTDQNGFLVNANGLYLVSVATGPSGGKRVLWYETTFSASTGSPLRCVYNDVDIRTPGPVANNHSVRLTDFLANTLVNDLSGAGIVGGSVTSATLKATLGKQSLQYSQYGSTIYDIGFKADTGGAFTTNQYSTSLSMDNATSSDNTVLSKSLEASNASMTQSVPELSLAQKLFSALTKVLQTKQTNVDGVLNLVR